MIRALLLSITLLLSVTGVFASHIMGGSIAYEYIGNLGNGFYRYKVIFTSYTNCDANSQIPFPESPIEIGVYHESAIPTGNKSLYTTLSIPLLNATQITPDLPSGCSSGVGVCIYEGVYEATVDVPIMVSGSFSKGYYLYYDRCCRNAAIINLTNPGGTGTALYSFIPPPITPNSSPTFSDVPVPFICVNDTAGILNTATDVDGDQLVFSFEDPLNGVGNIPNPLVWPVNPVNWAPGYNKNAPFGAGGYAYINAFTGYTRYMSPQTGNFVVAVQIKEYRNGNLIGISRRDLQLLVINCPVNPAPISNSGAQPSYTIDEGQQICFPVTFHDNGGDSLTLTAAGSIFNSTLTNPAATITTPVVGDSVVTTQFCWDTDCGQGRALPYIFTVEATDNGCPPKSTPAVISITVNPFPGPGAITGPSPACSGQVANYSVAPVANATYSWSVTGGTITSGATSNASTITWGNGPTGSVTLTATSQFGCAKSVSLNVNITQMNVSAGTDTSLCNGSSVTLSATGGSTYSWSPSSSLSNSTISNPVATPASTTTYTVTATTGSCSATDMVIVNVGLASISAGSNVSICNGSSTQLNASGATSYTWSPSGSLSAGNIANPVATPSSTTTYTVTGTVGNCTGTSTVIVTVSPIPTIDAGTNATICNGASTQLQATGGSAYTWSPSTALSNPSISNPVASPSVTTTYTVTGTLNGCSNTDLVIVNVNATPVVTVTPNPATFCNGGSVQLNANGAVNYTWNPATGLNNSGISNPIASPSSSLTYTVTGTNAFMCTSIQLVPVTVIALPTVNAGTDKTICNGSSVQLNVTGATTYTWNPSATLSNGSISNPVASPTSTTTYTVTGTRNGCTSTDQVIVNVNNLPVVNAGSDTTICSGQSVGLLASGATTYSWSPASTLNNSTVPNPTATPSASTTYTVTGTSNNCNATDQVFVNVSPLPVVNAGIDQTICSGTSATLSASGANTYTWTPAGSLSDPTSASPVASPVTSTTYTVTGTTNNCTAADQVIISVTALPVVSAGIDDTICNGGSINLSASGASIYSWSPSGSLNNSSISNPVASPSATITYTVTGTQNGCSSSDEVVIVVNNLPSASAGASQAICPGGSAVLSASGGTSYLWSPASSLSNPGISNPTASPASTTTYTVTVTDNGCIGTDTLVITVNVNVTASGDTTICAGQSVPLLATGATNFTWSPAASLSNPSVANPIASPTVTTTYLVTGSPNSCIDNDTVIVTVTPLPVVNAGIDQTICSGASANLSASGATSYSWTPAASLSNPSVSDPVASPLVTTTYTVTGTASNCASTDTVIVNVTPLPVINAGADQTICAGASASLLATGGSSYTWTPAASLNDASISNPVATPATTTTYVVLGTANACSSTDTVIVNVTPLPVVNAGADQTICSGTTANLLASGATSYTWAPASSLSNAAIANPVASPAVTTTYTVTGTANNCIATDTVSVNVTPLPPVNAGADQTICAGGSAALLATGGTTYTWSPSGSLNDATIANPVATPSSTTTYTVTGTSGNCFASDTLIVNVTPLPFVNAGSDQTICQGGSATLNATGATTYAWNTNATLSDTSVSNPLATPLATTTYTVTGTMNNCIASDQIIVTVTPLPVVNAGIDQTICSGASANLSASGATSYSWTPAASLSNPSVSDPVASPLVTTTYTVTGTASNCASTDTVIVNVTPLPVINAGADQTICAGASASLLATGGSSYAWTPAASLNDASISNPVATPATTTTYVVLGTANACSSTDTVIVNVTPLPVVNAGADQTICAGTTANLLASGATSYTWAPASSLSNAAIANPVASPAVTTTYTVTGTANNCIATDTVSVNVTPLPSVNAGADQTICAGGSAALLATGGTAYTWSPSGSLNDATIANPVATPSSTTTYTVTGTSGNCFASDTLIVNVTPLPLVNAGSDQTICQGGSATLNATGATTYAWNTNATLSDTSVSNPLATPLATTTYTVTGTMNNCIASDQVMVTVLTLPVVTAGADLWACPGSSVQLNASGGLSYSWSPALYLNNDLIQNPVSTPGDTITYVVSGTGSNSCIGTDTVTVFVNAIVPSDAGPDTITCSGVAVTIGGNPTSPNGTSFIWTPSGSLDNSTSSNPAASPLLTTTYVVVTTNDTCSGRDTVVVNVNPLPVADAGNDLAICPGDSVQLNGTGGIAYSWSPATDLSNPGISNPFASPSSATTYTLTVTDANGCVNYDSVHVSLHTLPSVSAGNDSQLCIGDSIQLQASGASTYIWNPAGTLSDVSIASPWASPSTTTTYTLTGTDNNSCKNYDTVVINVNPLPIADAGLNDSICIGSSITLEATGGIAYSWSPTSTLSDPLISDPVATPITSTTYTVTVTDTNNCRNTDSVFINVNPLPVVNAGPDTAVCSGDSVQLMVTGANIYLWSPGNSLSDSLVSSPFASPITTTTYTVTGSSLSLCVNTDTIIVKVNSLPVIDAGPAVRICPNDSIQLNATGALNYLWTPSSSLSVDTVANPFAFPILTTTYTVTGTDNNLCRNSDTVSVTVQPFPTILASGSTAICMGDSTQLFASGGNSYFWNPQSTLSDPGSSSPYSEPLSTTTYTVTGTDNFGCTATDTAVVIVNPLPFVNAGTDKQICFGDSTLIGGNPTAINDMTLNWSPVSGLGSSTDTNPNASPPGTTTYVVTISDINGCFNKDSMVLTVNPLPVVDAGSDSTICKNAQVTLGGTPTSSVPALTYTWSPSLYLNNSSTSNPISSPLTDISYSVAVVDVNGCEGTDTVELKVFHAISRDTSICENDSVLLGVQLNNATQPVSYLWSPASTLNSANLSNPTASPVQTTTYTLTLNDGGGCSDTITQAVSIKQRPVADFDFTAKPGCEGVLMKFVNTSSGADSFEWSFGSLGSSDDDAPVYLFPYGSPVDVVLTASYQGCTDTSMFNDAASKLEDHFKVEASNVFTPNNDGVNDLFLVEADLIGCTAVKIYNRWGNLIFDSFVNGGIWDGRTPSGEAVPEGVYFYVIELKNYSFRGSVTLSR